VSVLLTSAVDAATSTSQSSLYVPCIEISVSFELGKLHWGYSRHATDSLSGNQFLRNFKPRTSRERERGKAQREREWSSQREKGEGRRE
jgi:hypothetical protein